MSKDQGEQFDASVGLAFSLKAFEMFRKSGKLDAEVRGIPGIYGHCRAYIELVQGKTIACYVIDRKGERHKISPKLLLQLDNEKGPFSWVFRESTEQTPAALSAHDFTEAPTQPQQVSRSPIPHILVSTFDPKQLHQWTPQQQHYLHAVLSLIDGQRSISEIKYIVSLPPAMVDEAISILIALKAIALY